MISLFINIYHVDLRHVQTTKTTTNKTKTIQAIWVVVVYTKIKMLTPTGIITPVRVNIYIIYIFYPNELIPRECFCMLYAQRRWICLEWGWCCACYLLPATYITMYDFFKLCMSKIPRNYIVATLGVKMQKYPQKIKEFFVFNLGTIKNNFLDIFRHRSPYIDFVKYMTF